VRGEVLHATWGGRPTILATELLVLREVSQYEYRAHRATASRWQFERRH
jgi:hypothetical protein